MRKCKKFLASACVQLWFRAVKKDWRRACQHDVPHQLEHFDQCFLKVMADSGVWGAASNVFGTAMLKGFLSAVSGLPPRSQSRL